MTLHIPVPERLSLKEDRICASAINGCKEMVSNPERATDYPHRAPAAMTRY